jgi:hypothetical protein
MNYKEELTKIEDEISEMKSDLQQIKFNRKTALYNDFHNEVKDLEFYIDVLEKQIKSKELEKAKIELIIDAEFNLNYHLKELEKAKLNFSILTNEKI